MNWIRANIQLALWLAGLVAAVIAFVLIVIVPSWNERANKKASTHVTTSTAQSAAKGTADVAAVNAKTETKIAVVEKRAAAGHARIVAAPDPWGEFYSRMCESELYKDDPQCGSGSSGKRED